MKKSRSTVSHMVKIVNKNTLIFSGYNLYYFNGNTRYPAVTLQES